jgi:hypothetical protein
MDHFNATVKNGKLVKTRRGLQVSKQKFNGLSFVNTCPQDATPAPGSSTATNGPKPSQHPIRFIEEGGELRKNTFEAPKDDGRLEVPGTAQRTKRRRRGTRNEQSPTASQAETSSQPSPTPFENGMSQLPHSTDNQNIFQIHTNFGIPTSDTPEEVAWNIQPPLSEENWVLFERYLDQIPCSIYPYEDLLTYNPARGDDFHPVIRGDVAAQHCVFMCGSITNAVLSSETDLKDYGYHTNISKIFSILNQKLKQDQAPDAVTLHCIATLAWIGVCVPYLPLTTSKFR